MYRNTFLPQAIIKSLSEKITDIYSSIYSKYPTLNLNPFIKISKKEKYEKLNSRYLSHFDLIKIFTKEMQELKELNVSDQEKQVSNNNENTLNQEKQLSYKVCLVNDATMSHQNKTIPDNVVIINDANTSHQNKTMCKAFKNKDKRLSPLSFINMA